MRITRLTWTNYKGLADGAINADGSDVIVRGQNGVGKSTIAELLSFILFNKFSGETIKPYEGGRAQHDSNLIHGAEVTFDSGLTLRRNIDWVNGGNKSFCVMNGEPVSATEFKRHVMNLTNGGGELVINPFHFHEKLSKEARRNSLLEIIGVDENKELTPDEVKFLNGLTVNLFIKDIKDQLKNLNRDADRIPAKIEELGIQLAKPPVDHKAEIKQLESQMARLEVNISELETASDKLNQSAATNIKAEYESIMRQADTLKQTIERNQRELSRKENQRQELLAEWHKVKNSEPGFCPTCKQKIPEAQFKDAKKKKLDEIKANGEQVAAVKAELTEQIDADKKTLFELGQKAGALSTAANEQSDAENNRRSKLVEVKRAIADNRAEMNKLRDALASHKAEMKTDADNRAADTKRMNELQAELKELNKKIFKLEDDIRRAKIIRQRVIDTIEQKINSHFASVKFKLFDVKVTTGEASPTCEAFIHDVPYSALSKGEKLRCALETFRVIQDYYKVEMPLIIDDAESYTLNSFVDLPNQKWLFKVTDDDKLIIEVQKASVAA